MPVLHTALSHTSFAGGSRALFASRFR